MLHASAVEPVAVFAQATAAGALADVVGLDVVPLRAPVVVVVHGTVSGLHRMDRRNLAHDLLPSHGAPLCVMIGA